ncbi:MAG: DNA/RNA non-specific endonuclease [Bacteroidetes bacterium]|nr:DNA/RNA non-specific endonuclease [Bacteroidota bacterium]
MKSSNYLFGISIIIVMIAVWFVARPDKEMGSSSSTTEIQKDAPLFISFENLIDAYPLISDSLAQVRHLMAFDLSYNERHEQANWVMYVLTKEELLGTEKRKDNFRTDPKILTGSASLKDYKSSGYDRGHLAPAADMKWSKEVMSESFFMSNMSPQKPYFNRGVWKKLEEHVRKLVLQNDSILVITGPVFKDNIEIIGENEVTVPGYYFKVLVDLTWPDNKAIAYLLKNEKSSENLTTFEITIDSLEIFSNYDFFYASPMANKLEDIADLLLIE